MKSSIEEISPGAQPLMVESSKAFQAFCAYRDLGPRRSLDLAWQRFGADQGKDRGSARRPGYWAAWCNKNKWVERAEDYDREMDEARQSAAAEKRQNLQRDRSGLEVDDHQQTRKNIQKMDIRLEQMLLAPLPEVTVRTYDKATGKTTTTKIGFRAVEFSTLMRVRNDTARQAIEGYDRKESQKQERVVDRVVWTPAKKSDPDRQAKPEEDGSIDDFHSEEDKAA